MKKSRKLPAKYEARVMPVVKRMTKAIVAPPEQG
jgi:hypothetical protein